MGVWKVAAYSTYKSVVVPIINLIYPSSLIVKAPLKCIKCTYSA